MACRRYQLSGPLFGELVGTVWVDRNDGTLVKAEHPLRTSTDWNDFQLVRTGLETLDGLAWERFKLGLAEAVRASAGP